MATDINALVRRTLASNWVDMSQIQYRSARDVVILTGRFAKISSAEDQEIRVSDIENIDRALCNIKGVKRVRWQLENWSKETGDWKPV